MKSLIELIYCDLNQRGDFTNLILNVFKLLFINQLQAWFAFLSDLWRNPGKTSLNMSLQIDYNVGSDLHYNSKIS